MLNNGSLRMHTLAGMRVWGDLLEGRASSVRTCIHTPTHADCGTRIHLCIRAGMHAYIHAPLHNTTAYREREREAQKANGNGNIYFLLG